MATSVVQKIANAGGVGIPVSLTTSMGATTTEGILLGATNTATAGAQVFSPALHFQGSGWKTNATAAAVSCDWKFEIKPVQGAATPVNNFVISGSIDGGATYNEYVAFDPNAQGLCFAPAGVTSLQSVIPVRMSSNQLNLIASYPITWASSATNSVTGVDTGLSRISAGVVGVGTGAAGSVAGVISATSHMRVPLTVATLPAGATRGYTCIVTDASSPTFLATVVGGASTVTPVFYDGAAWKVG